MFVLHFSETIQLTPYAEAFLNPSKIKKKNNKAATLKEKMCGFPGLNVEY